MKVKGTINHVLFNKCEVQNEWGSFMKLCHTPENELIKLFHLLQKCSLIIIKPVLKMR